MTTPMFPCRRFSALVLIALLILPSLGTSAAESPENESKDGWWRDAVFYEIFVRSFADASNGPLAGDGVGDFQGLIERLDYLNDGKGGAGRSLGVTALWLMPIHPSPSYHGYDVTDYFGVHPQFGDVELVKRFIAEAHRRGIRVIIDFVLNHASSQHPLFLQAQREPADGETRELFRFADVPLELFGPWDQRAWHAAGSTGGGGFYYGVFSAEMPDWNFNHPKVMDHHYRAAEFWLREVGVDGFRLDAVRYFHEVGDALQDTDETRQWLRGFTEHCHRVKPGSFVIAENTARAPEVARGIRDRAVDSSFEFDLARATVEAVRLRTPAILTRTLERLDTIYEGDSPWASLLTNHDQERARTQLDGSESLTRLATKVLFTLPGVTFLYYGEELCMQAGKPDPELRTPMPWTAELPNAGFTRPDVRAWMAPKPDFVTVNVAAQQSDPESMLALYRRLAALNASSPALRHGRRVAVSSSARDVYVEMREAADEAVLVLGNFARESRACPALAVERSGMRSGWTVREEIDGAEVRAPLLDDQGGYTNWRPLAELKPESVYLIRWQR